MFEVDGEGGVRQSGGAVLGEPARSRPAVVSDRAEELDGPWPLSLRNARVVGEQPDHHGESRGVVGGALEEAVHVRDDQDLFVAPPRERAPDARGGEAGDLVRLQANRDGDALAASETLADAHTVFV